MNRDQLMRLMVVLVVVLLLLASIVFILAVNEWLCSLPGYENMAGCQK